MSYKSTILYDYPIAYYPLDEVSGTTAFDYSGCLNDSNYIGSVELNLLPLSMGCERATKINSSSSVEYIILNDYSGTSTTGKFGTANSSDNDFTIEFWFYPSFSTNNLTALVADLSTNVGVFYQNGNILFNLDSETVEYTLPSLGKAFHVSAVYSVSSASIYIDGVLVAYKSLSNFKFTNSTLFLYSGFTTSPDSFLINSVAVYRYALSKEQIEYHYYKGQALPAIHIVEPLNGELFEMYDNELSRLYKFEYPKTKSWQSMVTTGIEYNANLDCLQIIQTDSVGSSTVIIEDFISIPSATIFDSSKIEWDGDNGISIEASTDGTTYNQCINGQQIPGYTLNSFDTTGQLYLKITFDSTDTSRYIPRLFNLSILFYNDQIKYSENGTGYFSTLEEDAGISDYRVTLGKLYPNILSRHNRNGIRTVIDSGFEITTDKSIETIEFFYTPTTISDSGLISSTSTNGYTASNIYWHNSGTMSKTNIQAIYVNGANKTSETNVSNIFKPNELHHVIVVFSSPVSGDIRFNYSLYGSVSSLYQNIALYQSSFDSTQAESNYQVYINRENKSITDSSTITMTEDGISSYNNDWIVVQNI